MLIFISAPLRGDTRANIKNAKRYAKAVIEYDHKNNVFLPHTNYSWLDPRCYEDDMIALDLCKHAVRKCDALYIFPKPDCSITDGMLMEEQTAIDAKKPVKYCALDTDGRLAVFDYRDQHLLMAFIKANGGE